MSDSVVCDSHFHLFGGSNFPLAEGATPLDATQQGTILDLLSVFDAHGITHGLAVGPQPYGKDNSCLLAGIAAAKGRLKGIALVSPLISDQGLDVLGDAGIIGVRRVPTLWGLREFTEPGAERLLARIKERNWFLQIHAMNEELIKVLPFIRRSGIRVMIDHFGRPDVTAGIDQRGFSALLELGKSGDAIVKLTAAYRSSILGPPYSDVDPFVEAAIESFTLDRCVWGSDWPFTNIEGRIDYGPQLACLHRWLPDPADRTKVLSTNPAHFFGFAETS